MIFIGLGSTELGQNSSVRICHCTSLIKAFRWPLKVVNMGTAISETKLMVKWGKHQSVHKFQQYFASNCSLCLKMPLKLNFKALYETEKFGPSPRPHPHSDPHHQYTHKNRPPKTTDGFTTCSPHLQATAQKLTAHPSKTEVWLP